MTDVSTLIRSSSVNRALYVLGDWWTIFLLREAFLGVTTFERFRERLAIPRQTLANRLRALVDAGIFYLQPSDRGAARHKGHEYKLTPKGLDLYPHALMMWRWERKWAGAHASALPAKLVHLICGNSTSPRFTCAHCRAEVGLADVTYSAGPGAGAEAPEIEHRQRRTSRSALAGASGRAASVSTLSPMSQPNSAYVLSDRWAHLALAAVFVGCRSFDAIAATLGVATNILAHRLSVLVDAKLLEKRRSTADARRFEYGLTDRGRDVFPITLSLVRWADRWSPNPAGPAMLRVHRPCGHRLYGEVTCSECGGELKPWAIRFGYGESKARRELETTASARRSA